MKKIIVVLITFVMILGLVACNLTPEDKVASYVEDAQEMLEETFGGSGIQVDVEAEGCGIIVNLKISALNNLTSDEKSDLQRQYDSMSGTFESLLDEMQEEVPELEYMVYNVCESDGDLAAKIEIGK